VAAWLGALPPERRGEPEALLLAGAVARAEGRVGEAAAALRAAFDAARAAGRVDAEAAAMAQLSHVAWWQSDVALFGELTVRSLELEREGFVHAAPLGALGQSLFADTCGDFAGSLAHLEGVPDDGPPDVVAAADFLRARALGHLGRSEEAIVCADRGVARVDEPLPAARVQTLSTRWQAGRLDEVVDRLEAMRPGSDALPRDRVLTNLNLAIAHAFLGRVADAEDRMAEARRHAAAVEAGLRTRVILATVEAATAAARDDEDTARAMLTEALPDEVDLAALQPVIGMIGFVHVLVPATRPVWDGADLGPDHRCMLATAQALLDARAGGRGVPKPAGVSADRVLVALGLRWAMELAARTGDDDLAAGLLARCGAPARARLRSLAAEPGPAEGARALLKRLPAPPEYGLRIRLLGPPVIERDGVEVQHPDWRRERVRSLLCLLVARRRVTRDEVATALWPDLDTEAAAGNLRTTLGYLHRVLEPDRDPGDAPFFVWAQRDVLQLAPDGLTADVWELEEHLDAALAAEAAGTPSVALDRYEAAIALWRGEHLDGLYDDWAGPERDRLRSRFLAASVRAGELLVAKGEIDRALRIGTRAVETEPWSEPAHRLVIVAHLTRGDRSSARRALDRCRRAVADLGAEPEPETVMLERTLLGTPA
jgi:DNA-binding SARP family transcriptional activator